MRREFGRAAEIGELVSEPAGLARLRSSRGCEPPRVGPRPARAWYPPRLKPGGFGRKLNGS